MEKKYIDPHRGLKKVLVFFGIFIVLYSIIVLLTLLVVADPKSGDVFAVTIFGGMFSIVGAMFASHQMDN
jgi:hypothetical protein